jgi:hypothetical protein
MQSSAETTTPPVPQTRRFALPQVLRLDGNQSILLVTTILMFLFCFAVVPFIFERRSEGWLEETNRTNDPDAHFRCTSVMSSSTSI